MLINQERFNEIDTDVKNHLAVLVAVSKTKPVDAIRELYDLGQRDFGENYVQELIDKQSQLPNDIKWHFIGHLQSNKVKYIAPFVHLIHGVDSFKLIKEINKQAEKAGRVLKILLQVHVAKEETKFGFDENELADTFNQLQQEPLKWIQIKGIMGMASFTEDADVIRREFQTLKRIYDQYAVVQTSQIYFDTLSMGMSGDYILALEEGSTMVRVGSLIFGSRNHGVQ